jgi:hypothetical protein
MKNDISYVSPDRIFSYEARKIKTPLFFIFPISSVAGKYSRHGEAAFLLNF